MFLKPTPEMPEQAHRPGMAVRFSIGSETSNHKTWKFGIYSFLAFNVQYYRHNVQNKPTCSLVVFLINDVNCLHLEKLEQFAVWLENHKVTSLFPGHCNLANT